MLVWISHIKVFMFSYSLTHRAKKADNKIQSGKFQKKMVYPSLYHIENSETFSENITSVLTWIDAFANLAIFVFDTLSIKSLDTKKQMTILRIFKKC